MLDRPFVEIECKECHVIDIIYLIDTPGEHHIDLHGWSTCTNACCWLCKSCKGKNPLINVEQVTVTIF